MVMRRALLLSKSDLPRITVCIRHLLPSKQWKKRCKPSQGRGKVKGTDFLPDKVLDYI